ncbi:MAG TPA: SMP-30/gluconolactonase/LRE family protein [Tepidisphaeraceae bacterium]|nr:SMP-30/gluconolactonase/LRE family protein [Tepidisphaeraceae bacterium]
MRSKTMGCLSACIVLCLSIGLPNSRADEEYKLGPDSQEQQGVPQGKLEQFTVTSKIFHGTQRECWIYVPAQYDPKAPACVMIFQDGAGFQNRKGQWRAPVVFDNLIARKEMPVTIGIFVSPGVIPPPSGMEKALPRFNRSFEYDSPTDQYARFLMDEIIPEVAKKYNLKKDANSRAICGSSSGGSCAFTAAWQRPDQFSRVASFVGSFTNLRGDNFYPDVVRKTEPKPLRVFLQDGKKDLNIYAGNWVNANKELAEALEFAGYDYQYVLGEEGHNSKHGSAIFPDVVRWLWRDYPKPVQAMARPSKQPVMDILDPAAEWEQVGDTFGFTEGPASDGKGNVYFTDIPHEKIYKADEKNKVTQFAEDTGGGNGLMFGPDGKLYCCQMKRNRVVAYDAHGREEVVAEEINAVNDIAINHEGGIYVSEPPRHQVIYISPKHQKVVVAKDPLIMFPNGVRFTPDQSQIVVADTKGVRLWAFQVTQSGALAHREAFYDAQVLPGTGDDGADGMCFDKEGRLYVCTHLGLQVFDQAGRVIAIINKPQNQWLANCCFGGPNLEYLYVCNGDRVFRRKTRTQGVLSWKEPITPTKPKL